MTLSIGDRIYYTGDMANDQGRGVVFGRDGDNVWGANVDILMDDGRVIKGLEEINFSERYLGHGGTRFVLESEYMRWRAERISDLQEAVR